MPTMRATVTVADACPNAARPTASTAAVDRGVTVSPKPKPNSASPAAAVSMAVTGVQAAMRARAAADAPRPTTVTRRRGRMRTAKPDTSAPAAVARPSDPRAIRCSSGPP